MFETFGRSWEIVKKCFGVLMSDKKLLAFPLISSIALLLVTASFILPFAVFEWFAGPLVYVALFAFYLASYFVIIFFNSALVHASMNRIDNKPVSLTESLGFASSKLPSIFLWSLVSATVGLILNSIERAANRQGGLGGIALSIVVGIIGFAWSLGTYFVIPIMIFENQGPFSAIKRSIDLLKKTWGEKFIAGAGIGLFFFLLYLLGIGLLLLGIFTPLGLFAIGPAVVYLVLVFLAQSTLQGIFLAALYKYATSGQAALFEQHELEGAFRKA
jgi:hypothetical protein